MLFWNSKFSVIVFSVLSVIVLSSPVFSDNSTELVGIKTLGHAMKHVDCRMTLVVSYVNNLALIAPEAVQNPNFYLNPLKKDQEQLQNYTNNGDVTSFRTYLKNNFDPDFKQFKSSLDEQLKKSNFSPAQLDSIRKKFASYKTDYDLCAFTTLNDYAAEKINAYNFLINKYQLEMLSLSSKGVDIYPLVALLQKENNQILIPLNTISNTVNPAVNGSADLRQAINKYCLFDGCENGLNGHLSANFEATKLQVILIYMKNNTKYINAKDILKQAQTSLNNVQIALTSLDTAPYTSSEQVDQIWGNINAASADLRKVVNIYGG